MPSTLLSEPRRSLPGPSLGTATQTWVWVVTAGYADGATRVEATFAFEAAALAYIASQSDAEAEFRAEPHVLHQDAPAAEYGLLARSARFIGELQAGTLIDEPQGGPPCR